MMLALVGIATITIIVGVLALQRIWRMPAPTTHGSPAEHARVTVTGPFAGWKSPGRRQSACRLGLRRKEQRARVPVRGMKVRAV